MSLITNNKDDDFEINLKKIFAKSCINNKLCYNKDLYLGGGSYSEKFSKKYKHNFS
jgi:hypothetical protein